MTGIMYGLITCSLNIIMGMANFRGGGGHFKGERVATYGGGGGYLRGRGWPL